MRIPALLALVLALSGACSSASDRPSSYDEQQAQIERDRERAQDERRDERRAERADNDSPDGLDNDGIDNDGIDDDGVDESVDRDRSIAAKGGAAGGVDTDSDVDNDEAADDHDGVAKHDADNTGRNARDDKPGNLTALDQSNSKSDVDITQAIRKKVVADDGLSFNAKNVKIITVSGKVTLRGPVKSPAESSAIEKSARGVPGVVQVDNQIEVER